VRLEYQADQQAGCVGEGDLRRRVSEQLGRDPFRADADRRVAISIARTESGFQGRIVWTEGDGRAFGERTLSSRTRDCREIEANVAFAVAVQLQLVESPGARREAPPTTIPPPVRPPPAKTPDTINPPPPPATLEPAPGSAKEVPVGIPEQGPPAAPSFAVGLGPAIAVGMTPAVTALGRLFVGVRRGRVSAEIAGDSTLGVRQPEPDGTGATVTAMGATVAGCAHLSVLATCALGRLGWIRAVGMGVDAPNTGWGRFSEVGMRLAGTMEWGRFALSLHVDTLVMLSRWNVVLNQSVVWTVPRVGGLLGVDVGLRFF
jgi:hypothetical protein